MWHCSCVFNVIFLLQYISELLLCFYCSVWACTCFLRKFSKRNWQILWKRAVKTSSLYSYWSILENFVPYTLTLSWRKALSYKKKSIDLLCKSVDWFLYDRELRHERVKNNYLTLFLTWDFSKTFFIFDFSIFC